MAVTTVTTLTNTISTYYDRIMLDVLDPALKYYQFGAKKALPTGEGKTVVWNLPYKLATGLVLSEGVPAQLSTGYALSTTKVSAIVRQFGGWTTVSDFVDMTSITDVMTMAHERLGAQAAETIDRVIMNECFISHVAGTNTSPHHFVKTSVQVEEFWSSVSGVSATVVGGPIQYCSSTNVLAVSDIRKATYALRSLNVPTYDGKDYIAIMPTEVAEDIAGDTTFISFHQYVDKGIDALYNGEIGRLYNCRIIEAPRGLAVRGSNTNGLISSVAYGTVIMGKGFYGVTELDGGIKTFTSQGAQKYDPLNQVTTVGWKANFISKLLNVSAGLVYWSGSGDTVSGILTESAGSGLRFEYPASY